MNEHTEIVTETTEDQAQDRTAFVLMLAINAISLGMMERAKEILLQELRRRLPNCTGPDTGQ